MIAIEPKKRRFSKESRRFYGAGDRDRTGTLFTARDFKSLVSACSTTPAFLRRRSPQSYPRILSQANAPVKYPFSDIVGKWPLFFCCNAEKFCYNSRWKTVSDAEKKEHTYAI